MSKNIRRASLSLEIAFDAAKWESPEQLARELTRVLRNGVSVDYILSKYDDVEVGELRVVDGPSCPWCEFVGAPIPNDDDPDEAHRKRNPVKCAACGGVGGPEDWGL